MHEFPRYEKDIVVLGEPVKIFEIEASFVDMAEKESAIWTDENIILHGSDMDEAMIKKLGIKTRALIVSDILNLSGLLEGKEDEEGKK